MTGSYEMIKSKMLYTMKVNCGPEKYFPIPLVNTGIYCKHLHPQS